jgi:hypothetical protein
MRRFAFADCTRLAGTRASSFSQMKRLILSELNGTELLFFTSGLFSAVPIWLGPAPGKLQTEQ